MNILVTGATGFLGGTLTKTLVQDDQNVRILARKASNLHFIKSAGHNLHHDKPEIVMEIMESFLEKTSL